jgi:FAD/FMN-containing dehydrogenase
VLRYGNARELCLGLEVVTATGDIWDGLSGLRKDNTGYDLRNVFIGSEGTLGIITGATLKLYPQPAAKMTALAAVPSIDMAVRLLQLAQARLASGLTGFEVMSEFSLSLVRKHFPPPAPAVTRIAMDSAHRAVRCRERVTRTLAVRNSARIRPRRRAHH